jgi:hypothetical protein
MPWYERNQKKYYYRSERDANGRPRRRYVGTSAAAAAQQAAAEDERRRRERQAADAAWAAELAELREIDALVERLCRLTDLLLAAELTAANYHKHGGEWRLSRGHENRVDRPEDRFEGPGRG